MSKSFFDNIKLGKTSGNISIQKKISEIIVGIEESPFNGIGKPEALKYNYAGKWSRCIDS